MRVLWLCNIVLPEFCEIYGIKKVNVGGWLSGMWNQLNKCSKLTLGICLPIRDRMRIKDGMVNGCKYYAFHFSMNTYELNEQMNEFEKILDDFKPHVVHIWGTEYQHTLAMIEACEKVNILDRVVLNIQGLVSVYARHYDYGLPKEIVEKMDEDYLSIRDEYEEFAHRGLFEIKAIKKVKYVIGRTDWDKACTYQINRQIIYYKCGEILRDVFYDNCEKWDIYNCDRHSIFLSQASYPIKGLHTILEQLSVLARLYEDFFVYIAGTDLSQVKTIYAKYVMDIIKSNHLENNIIFIGNLTAEEMYKRYLKANVFLSPSIIENSANSICESMMVGVPVVSSMVGGIPSMIEHKISGYLYSVEEPYMMRYYIEEMFNNDVNAKKISIAERCVADQLNHKDKCADITIQVYKEINNNASLR